MAGLTYTSKFNNGSKITLTSSTLIHSVRLGDTLKVGEDYVIVDEVNYTECKVVARLLGDLELQMTRQIGVVSKDVRDANLKRSKAEWDF